MEEAQGDPVIHFQRVALCVETLDQLLASEAFRQHFVWKEDRDCHLRLSFPAKQQELLPVVSEILQKSIKEDLAESTARIISAIRAILASHTFAKLGQQEKQEQQQQPELQQVLPESRGYLEIHQWKSKPIVAPGFVRAPKKSLEFCNFIGPRIEGD